MDHGNVPLIFNENYLRQRREGFRSQPWPRRTLSNLRFALYCRVLTQLLRYATAHTSRFLVAGDEVEESYRRRLGVLPDRIIRYPYMVDVKRFTMLDAAIPQQMRSRLSLPVNALVVTMINRLTPEKDLDTAIRGIAEAYAALPENVRSRMRVVIAGSGPLRARVESQIAEHGLADVCTLFGEATPEEVAALLSASDIFLYTGNRGTNYSVAVLEAMAAGCAVVATTDVRSNARVLAEGRGYPVPAGEARSVAGALARALTHDDERRFAGMAAHAYVAEHHSADALRRCLRQATGWIADIDSLTIAPAPAALPAAGRGHNA
jgi:glycosyltransferase involved in cell wall biosynthesis